MPSTHAVQVVQLLSPAAEYLPESHAVHDVSPDDEVLPAAQFAHDLSEPATCALPWAQFVCFLPAAQLLLQEVFAPFEPVVDASPFTHAVDWYSPDPATVQSEYCVLEVTVHAEETYLLFTAPPHVVQLEAPAAE